MLPRPGPRRSARCRRLDADCVETGKVKWSRPGALVSAENKQQITLRLDAEVLAFFKNTGERYQSRINAVLREYVRAHRDTD